MANVNIESPGASDSSLRTALQALYPTHSGASVTKASHAATDYTSGAILSWDTEGYDNGGWFAGGSPTRLTVPSGVTRVDVEIYVTWGDGTGSGQRWELWLKKDGSFIYPALKFSTYDVSWHETLSVMDVSVTAGNYFEAYLANIAGDNSVTLGTASYFKIRAREVTS
jgi:hypothetical protein